MLGNRLAPHSQTIPACEPYRHWLPRQTLTGGKQGAVRGLIDLRERDPKTDRMVSIYIFRHISTCNEVEVDSIKRIAAQTR
jgi:hypothetical protein